MAIAVPFTGGCACGGVRYGCSAAPLVMFRCHCRDCQRATGSPFAANVWVAASAFAYTSGEPKYYVVKSARGTTVYHGFCPACGSPLGMHIGERPDFMGIRAASLDDPRGLEPVADLWTCRVYPWDSLNPDLRQFETQPTPEEFQALLATRS
jgi:hypothetical protein